MTQEKAIGWARLLGLLTLLSLGGNWRTFAQIRFLFQGVSDPIPPLTALLFLVAGLLAGWSLITDRHWGFWLFYAYATLGWLLLSVVLIPALPGLFPPGSEPWIGILINGVAILLALRIQLILRPDGERAPSSPN